MKEYFSSLFATPLMAAAQAIGFAAMTCAIICFAQKKRKNIIVWQIITLALWVLHFIMLGNPTAAAINSVQIVRNLVFINREKHEWASKNIWPVLFIVLTLAMGIFTWQSPLSLMPMIATSLATVAIWMKKPLNIRLLTLPVSLLWCIYDFLTKSIAGTCNEIFTIITIVIAIFTIDLKQTEREEIK
jgi:hypothetical protein